MIASSHARLVKGMGIGVNPRYASRRIVLRRGSHEADVSHRREKRCGRACVSFVVFPGIAMSGASSRRQRMQEPHWSRNKMYTKRLDLGRGVQHLCYLLYRCLKQDQETIPFLICANQDYQPIHILKTPAPPMLPRIVMNTLIATAVAHYWEIYLLSFSMTYGTSTSSSFTSSHVISRMTFL